MCWYLSNVKVSIVKSINKFEMHFVCIAKSIFIIYNRYQGTCMTMDVILRFNVDTHLKITDTLLYTDYHSRLRLRLQWNKHQTFNKQTSGKTKTGEEAFTFLLGEQTGGVNLTTSMASPSLFPTKKRGSPFSLWPPITKGLAVKISLEGTLGGGTGGEEKTSSGDWRRFSVSCVRFAKILSWFGEAIGAPVLIGNSQRSGLAKGEACLKFSRLRTGFSWKGWTDGSAASDKNKNVTRE